jgi:competence protein ComGC
MKRNHRLVVLILVSILMLALIPALAAQQDLKPAADSDKFQRMGKAGYSGKLHCCT